VPAPRRYQVLAIVWAIGLALAAPTLARASQPYVPPNRRAIKQIALGLQLWCDTFRWTLLSSTGGSNARSWRVEVLPMIEEISLRKSYDDTQSWKSPTNQKMLSQRPQAYEPSALPAEAYAYLGVPAPGETTRFVAVVDQVTAWQPGQGFDLRRTEDGTDNTVVFIEAPELAVLWTEPRDATLSEAVSLLGSPVHRYSDHFFYVREWVSEWRYVAFADGHVEEVAMLNPQAATAYLTSAGNDAHLVTAAYDGPWRRPTANVAIRHVKWDRVLPAVVIAALIGWIVLRATRNRRRERLTRYLSSLENRAESSIQPS
jgi:prepilin-type processing-associated H-X9-DG protein